LLSGGTLIDDISEQYGVKVAGLIDPDGNSIEIYEENSDQ